MFLVVVDGRLPVLLNHFHTTSKAILIVSSISYGFAKEISLLVGALLGTILGRFGCFVWTAKQIPKALSALMEHGADNNLLVVVLKCSET